MALLFINCVCCVCVCVFAHANFPFAFYLANCPQGEMFFFTALAHKNPNSHTVHLIHNEHQEFKVSLLNKIIRSAQQEKQTILLKDVMMTAFIK